MDDPIHVGNSLSLSRQRRQRLATTQPSHRDTQGTISGSLPVVVSLGCGTPASLSTPIPQPPDHSRPNEAGEVDEISRIGFKEKIATRSRPRMGMEGTWEGYCQRSRSTSENRH